MNEARNRLRELGFSDETIELFIDLTAEEAKERIIEEIYTSVGRSAIRKAGWIVGLGIIALAAYLMTHGLLVG